ncbi:monocarboxylate transporter 12 isoform X1 [Patagioenas fasciata]|uniref:monocarboxylate transporter 12 isoform X1 n=1 Tax=Patagioenas fasciata TaxID=372321 RepID=UPI003A9A5370
MVPLMTTDRAGASVRGSAPRSAAGPAAGSAGGSEGREPAATLPASGFSLGSRRRGRPRRPWKLPWAQSSLRSGGETAVPPGLVRRGASGAKPCSPRKAQPGPRPGASGVTTPAGAAHTDRGRPRSSRRHGGSGPGGGCSLQEGLLSLGNCSMKKKPKDTTPIILILNFLIIYHSFIEVFFLNISRGLGFALCYSPAIAMVGKYFNKRKALAYGIAMSGSGIGTFILAPVVQLLIEQFSWRGALLILGGFVLNLCVCGALMRPIALKEDHKTTPEFLEQDYVPRAQKGDLKQVSICSPLIKAWSRECLCYCSWKEYDFLLMPGFMVLAVSILFMAYGCSPLFVYLVPYALSVGVSHHQAAFLMSILGVIDIIGNVTFGWLTDRRCLKKHRHFCYLFAVGMDGLCCLFLPILQNFPLLVPFSFTFGYFDGAYVTLIPVVTADVVGTSSLSSALGVVYFLHAIPYLVSPPVAGWLVDTTGSYTASFLLCGFSMIFSSTLLCFARLAKKIKRRHLQSLTNDTGTKQHIWTNGAIAYSVTAELDQKDVEFLAVDTNSYSNR